MSLKDLFSKAGKVARAGSAMSHVTADGKPMRKKFIVTIEQTVRAESRETVDAAVEMLEAQLQKIGGLTPLIEMCDLESPIIADGLPDVSVEEKGKQR